MGNWIYFTATTMERMIENIDVITLAALDEWREAGVYDTEYVLGLMDMRKKLIFELKAAIQKEKEAAQRAKEAKQDGQPG